MALTKEGCRLFFHLLLRLLAPRCPAVFSMAELCALTAGLRCAQQSERAGCFQKPHSPPSGKRHSWLQLYLHFSWSAGVERQWACQGSRTEAAKHQEWCENAFCGPMTHQPGWEEEVLWCKKPSHHLSIFFGLALKDQRLCELQPRLSGSPASMTQPGTGQRLTVPSPSSQPRLRSFPQMGLPPRWFIQNCGGFTDQSDGVEALQPSESWPGAVYYSLNNTPRSCLPNSDGSQETGLHLPRIAGR